MTNLKGVGTHENRKCLQQNDWVQTPVAERIFTMVTFLCGAVIYAALYGNIGSFLNKMDAAGTRYRARMDELNEFLRFQT